MKRSLNARVNEPVEWGYTSSIRYASPFNDIELDVVVSDENGAQWRVPAYWAGDMEWRARFAAPHEGRYSVRSVCSDTANAGLHDQTDSLEVAPYNGDNPLFRHGGLRVSENKRYLEHSDGTPFFWLADTWWMGLSKRLAWPGDFQRLVADRKAKGFSVAQFVAGLFPDMPPLDPRCENEAGLPWEPDFAAIRPAYYDMADLRVQWLVKSGIVPCVLGCWGYYVRFMGVETMKKHWRYLVARWGAYPVVWCLAGEGAMPYYLSKNKDEDKAWQKTAWTEVARYLRQIDPYHRPITIHPTDNARDQVDDPSVLDFEMLQTGHDGTESIANTVSKVALAVAREPRMPVVCGEVNYEGIFGRSRDDVQRFMFWSCMLGGTCGHTYGACGIWQANTAKEPFGASPHGHVWSNTPWDVALQYPGSAQVGVGKSILEQCEWWRLENHQEWVEPSANAQSLWRAYVAGIPGELLVAYFPMPIYPWSKPVYVKALEPGVSYDAAFFDPRTGEKHCIGSVQADAEGKWVVPVPPTTADWVLMLARSR